MKLSRTCFLAACTASPFIVTAAQAQVTLPPVELRGAGSSTPGDVAVRSLNCIGKPGLSLNKYGTNSGELQTIVPGSGPGFPNGIYDCELQEIQQNFEAKYIGTGSAQGRQIWRTFTTNSLNGTAGKINPFTGGAGIPSAWPNAQFSFSETPVPVGDLSEYNLTAQNAVNKAGPAIQLPLFVMPIAFAYNPSYGIKNIAGFPVELNFNLKFPARVNNVTVGGLRLNRVAYCKIFNGEITNWNDPLLKTLNGNVALLDVMDDTLVRWTTEGVPIRLVGRADRSGGTNVFTRALAAQCNGGQVTTNKYNKAAEALPYDNLSTIDIRRLRSDTSYFPASASSNFSGSLQSLNGLVFDRASNVICKWNEVNAATARCDVSLAPGGIFTNTAPAGLFMVADGSTGVAEAIEMSSDNALLPSATFGIQLNGKFGYVGADFVAPVPGRRLHSAALQKGNVATGTAYLMPSAQNAALAFGTTVLPPQTIAASGAFNVADARMLGANDPYAPISGTNPAIPVNRLNPLHWGAVIYNPNIPVIQTLASPAAGYPVTGVDFFLTYTCFKPGNPAVPGNNAKRFAIAEYVGLMFGKVPGSGASTNLFKGTLATSPGILTKSNTAVPSAGWQNAITETFLKKSTQASGGQILGTLGGNGLWLQDNFPTTPSDVDSAQQVTDQKSNPTCDPNFGA